MKCMQDWPEDEESKRTRPARERLQALQGEQRRLKAELRRNREMLQAQVQRERDARQRAIEKDQHDRDFKVLRAALQEIPEARGLAYGINYWRTLHVAHAVVLAIECRRYYW